MMQVTAARRAWREEAVTLGLGVSVSGCVCVGLWVFTHSYSFLLDPSYWEYFSSQ